MLPSYGGGGNASVKSVKESSDFFHNTARSFPLQWSYSNKLLEGEGTYTMNTTKKNAIHMQDIHQIDRPSLGKNVSLELFRMIRLIGIYNSLPMGGRSTTNVVGRAIGDQLEVSTVDELLRALQTLGVGIPRITERTDSRLVLQLDECMVCSGMEPIGERICDFEGAILEAALTKVLGKRVSVKETKCNMMGEGCCEYTATIR